MLPLQRTAYVSDKFLSRKKAFEIYTATANSPTADRHHQHPHRLCVSEMEFREHSTMVLAFTAKAWDVQPKETANVCRAEQ
jgi:hypothetical protein